MANCLDYISWRGDLSCELSKVNEVDRMLFSVVGKPDYTGIIPASGEAISLENAVEQYLDEHANQTKIGLLGSPLLISVLRKMADSERYRNIRLTSFVNKVLTEEEEQFSALTVSAPDGVSYISFRGTDDSLVGWKENCELAVQNSVPAQRDALAYLRRASELCEGPLVVCGHSKGGNLAVYAACCAEAEIQDRILAVYSYDGPGFQESFMTSDGYLRMESRIITYVPQRSIVGMLLNTAGKQSVVFSGEGGVAAHDVLNWSVDRNGLIPGEELSALSSSFHLAINETLDGMAIDERQELVEEIFDLLYSTGASMLSDFSEGTLRKTLEMAKHFRKASELHAFLLRLSEITLKSAVTHQRRELFTDAVEISDADISQL